MRLDDDDEEEEEEEEREREREVNNQNRVVNWKRVEKGRREKGDGEFSIL